ncbi:hypothetical protein BCR39DRAFT_588974 [Naematelia encephala]|uniref:Uncharacterized protein n=1 Tax=Naematelia encephala TaxID=71784 RepID=A0A1Y2AZA0_9TREE|nr:hypothetical protein BCR39DRAFT_588974 [Naematelia encephala]
MKGLMLRQFSPNLRWISGAFDTSVFPFNRVFASNGIYSGPYDDFFQSSSLFTNHSTTHLPTSSDSSSHSERHSASTTIMADDKSYVSSVSGGPGTSMGPHNSSMAHGTPTSADALPGPESTSSVVPTAEENKAAKSAEMLAAALAKLPKGPRQKSSISKADDASTQSTGPSAPGGSGVTATESNASGGAGA